jgi:hypothetical protein
MKNLFFASFITLLLFSCGKESSYIMSADQHASVTEFMLEFDKMSANESPVLRSKIEAFYQVATVNNCEVENFPDVVTPEEVNDYIANIGHTTIRSIHDWSVKYGNVIRGILKDNPNWNENELISDLISEQFAQLKGGVNTCELEMYTTYTQKSLDLANSFGVYIGGAGYRPITNEQLLTFGGAFNTFVRMQDLQDTCGSSDSLLK